MMNGTLSCGTHQRLPTRQRLQLMSVLMNYLPVYYLKFEEPGKSLSRSDIRDKEAKANVS